jgi:hypothetical protein
MTGHEDNRGRMSAACGIDEPEKSAWTKCVNSSLLPLLYQVPTFMILRASSQVGRRADHTNPKLTAIGTRPRSPAPGSRIRWW